MVRPLAWTAIGGLSVGVVFLSLAWGAMPVSVLASLYFTLRLQRTYGLGRTDKNKLLFEPIRPSRFWKRPDIARLLSGVSAGSSATDMPESPSAIVENLAAQAAALPEPARRVATQAVDAAKAKAAYSVAKEKCAEADHVKQVCLEEAKAADIRARADAKAALDAADATKPAKETSTVSTSKP